MATRTESTRVSLIETAERLFAERGIESVSLRDICAEAGQRNHAAAQYHFGDRAGLVGAVYEHRMRTVNERRHAMLDKLAEGADHDVRAIVEALVYPLTDVVAESSGWYGRFLARTRWNTFAQSVLVPMPVLSGYRRAISLLVPLLKELGPGVRASRFVQMESLVIGTVAGWEWQRHRGERALPLVTLRADLVSTASAVAMAPVTAPGGTIRPGL